ncbi:MAG TPA: bifunctional precorrin-2 dehydrogenase/sirohydrochlorin ferrochelatase [Candidatus Acidoferrales bacterium]|jgi:precorrin-2 dehydrogenase/sirohydrochlorin ferrochelatase|nr:bifunctional precorrin-2 dehydrogenase/sirohydrochlorin ferrochelatase [Candidatus Acidoferrales bacterium]
MILFPAFLKLAGKRCVVVGAGPVAEEKIEGLLRAGADVRVTAPEATRRIRELARKKKLQWDERAFRASDLSGAFVVVAATSSAALHAAIYRRARRRGVLCNVVDDPEHCDFYYGSVVRRGELQIAISTAGQSPALAQRLRKKLEKEFGAEYEKWLEELGKVRKKLFAKKMAPEERRALLHRLASEASLEEFVRRKKRKSRG